jgi:hypothetical protein
LVFTSSLSQPLIQAYRETHFKVTGPLGFTMMVDHHSPSLESIHVRHCAQSSAFITACNPLGVELTVDENDTRQRRLASDLEQRGLSFYDGVGQHPTGDWPGEASFLIIGLDLDGAKDLATQLEQNALVWAGQDAIPRLILLR